MVLVILWLLKQVFIRLKLKNLLYFLQQIHKNWFQIKNKYYFLLTKDFHEISIMQVLAARMFQLAPPFSKT